MWDFIFKPEFEQNLEQRPLRTTDCDGCKDFLVMGSYFTFSEKIGQYGKQSKKFPKGSEKK